MTLQETLNEGSEFLSLSDEELERLPDVLSQLGKIRVLYLAHCSMSSPMDRIWMLANVEDLTTPVVRGRIPEGVRLLKKLRRLTIVPNTSREHEGSERSLQRLPTWLGELECLEEMTLKEPGFVSMPDALYDASPLRRLHVVGGHLRGFEAGLATLRRLRAFSVSSCPLSSVPYELGDLPELEQIRFWRAPIGSLPAEALRSPQLDTVSVSDCGLRGIPDDLWLVRTLTVVDLSENPIGELSDCIASAINLQLLDVSGCGLQRVPAKLWSIPALRAVKLSRNTFSADGHVELERGIARRPHVEVALPRRSGCRARQERDSSVTEPAQGPDLSSAVSARMMRLGAKPNAPAVVREQLRIGDDEYPVTTAFQQLLYGYVYPVTFSAPITDMSDLRPVELHPGSYDLEEYECTYHAPYFQIGMSKTSPRLLVRLDDEHPDDPMVYWLDNDGYGEVEANPVLRLSQWLALAQKA